MEIYTARINGLKNPIGYEMNCVLCSWKVRGSLGKNQKEAVVRVWADPASSVLLYEKKGDLNCAGEPLSLSLAARTRYYWKVTVTSDAGETAESELSYFETGKREEAWEARWIGTPDSKSGRSPEFQTAFRLEKTVKTARLYICGLGLFEAYVNGEKVGEDLLAPFINDYKEHFQICTYEVTSLLMGENTLSVLLGDGWYRGRFGLFTPPHYERPYALLAELRIAYTDGSEQIIGTDDSFLVRESFTTRSDIYDGEIQDHSLLPGEWKKADLISAPGKICERYSPQVCYQESLPVREVILTPAGETVLDFGQNFAGHVVVTQTIPAGETMKLEFGEILQNGNFYNENYRSAKSEFIYVSDGRTREIRPRFTFFGFRYVKVSGLSRLDPACFTGRALYSKLDRTGFLTTGHEKINRLYENSLWSLRSNFLDMPTDCPQRDERLGWTGDAQVFSTTAGFHMDTRAFYHKFLKDLRTDQLRNNGGAATYLPTADDGMVCGVWSDIATILPKMVYDYYGSKERLAEDYPLMRDWVDYLYRKDCERGQKNLYDWGFQYGDWLALDGATEQSVVARTDNGYLCSVYYYASTTFVAEAAHTLGLPEEEAYRKRAEEIRSAVLREYFTPSGRLAIDTQTAYLIALKFGLYLDKEKVIEGLRTRFRRDLNRLKGGFAGATMMNCVLAENGMEEIAYDLLFFEGFPGWLYAINLGATTIWERWNSVLPDGSISGTGMNSLNHYAYGSVVEFLYRYAAGIRPMAPGFRKVCLQPLPDRRLSHLSCAFDSVAGCYRSAWKILPDGYIDFVFEIPFGCTAKIVLPDETSREVTAGRYEYRVRPGKDVLQLYSETTPYEILFRDERARTVLRAHLPEIAKRSPDNAEDMAESLKESRERASAFGKPTECFDRAIAEISKLR